MRVPFFRSPWQSDAAAASRLATVLAGGAYVLGDEGAAFEAEFSAWLGSRAVLGVNSGTDALVLALTGLGIGPGDEVILPSYCFIACFEAVARVGAAPVLVDSGQESFLPGLEQIEASVGPATLAVVAVPLFGETTGLRALQQFCQQRGLLLVEDAAQACGGLVEGRSGAHQLVGTLGDASAFSFYPTKTIGAAGDAGAVSFHDAACAERCRALRNHGLQHGEHREIGLNSRLDELQAALLRIGLRGLDDNLTRRREIAKRYGQAMAGLPLLRLPALSFGHAWNYFVVRHPRRDMLRQQLAVSGIDTRVYYPRPLHREQVYLRGFSPVRLPNCEQLAEQSLALPLYPALLPEQIEMVIDAMRHACFSLAVET